MTQAAFTLHWDGDSKAPFARYDYAEALIDLRDHTITLSGHDTVEGSRYIEAEAKGLVARLNISPLRDGSSYVRLWENPGPVALLTRITNGVRIESRDDRGEVGIWADDAINADRALRQWWQDVDRDDPGEYTRWDAADWFNDSLPVNAGTSDEELARIIETEGDTARIENAIIDDIAEYLRSRRDELRG